MPDSFANQFMVAVIESPLHPLVGTRLAVVRVEGRRTGRIYATPINVDREGDGWMATSLKSRTWWRNLRNGQRARLTVGGKRITVEAVVEEGSGPVEAGLLVYFGRHPTEYRHFGIRVGADGRPLDEDVRRVAAERVIIRLKPT